MTALRKPAPDALLELERMKEADRTLPALLAAAREARDHLGAALVQALASDDEIIIGHVRDAHDGLHRALCLAVGVAVRPRAAESPRSGS